MRFTLRRPMDALYQPIAAKDGTPTVLVTGTVIEIVRASAYPVTYRHQEWLNFATEGMPPLYYARPIDILIAIAEGE